MDEIQKYLLKNIQETLVNVDQNLKKELNQITSPTICSGVGGSYPVAIFASKVLSEKNKVIASPMPLLEILQSNNVQTVFVTSHSGKNTGVKQILAKVPNAYLLSTRKSKIGHSILLNYKPEYPEKSFISLGNTILPISILMNYYNPSYEPKEFVNLVSIPENFEVVEIFSDYNTKSAAAFLECTITEANMGTVIIHDKYSFCHGRNNYTYFRKSLKIYLCGKQNQLDKFLLNIFQEYQIPVTLLETQKKDPIEIDYELILKSFNLLLQMARLHQINLCKIKYAPYVPKLYHFKWEEN